MADDFTYDVFFSHNSKDKLVVRAIAEQLRADNLRVWFDEWELRPGDSIPAKIEAGLEGSRVLVLCMSAQAFGSDWATLESQTFRFRDPLNKERRFIPLGSTRPHSKAPWRSSFTSIGCRRTASRSMQSSSMHAGRQRCRRWRKHRPYASGEQKRSSNSIMSTRAFILTRSVRMESEPSQVPMTRPCGCGTWRRALPARVRRPHETSPERGVER
jgi:TIR domain